MSSIYEGYDHEAAMEPMVPTGSLDRGQADGVRLAEGHRAVGFSVKAVGYYFPRLYPEGVEMEAG
jgi:hypothetical protein